MCEASKEKLFTRNAAKDIQTPNPCKPKVVNKVEVEEVIYEGKKLMYDKHNNKYYEYSEKYDKYVLYKNE
jgi:hypothetical protein